MKRSIVEIPQNSSEWGMGERKALGASTVFDNNKEPKIASKALSASTVFAMLTGISATYAITLEQILSVQRRFLNRKTRGAEDLAYRGLQSRFGEMYSCDIKDALVASYGTLPAKVTLGGRAVVLEWILNNVRKPTILNKFIRGTSYFLLAAALYSASKTFKKGKILEASTISLIGLTQAVGLLVGELERKNPPKQRKIKINPSDVLNTRSDWVKAYPEVLEGLITDPVTGRRRGKEVSILLAESGQLGLLLVSGKIDVMANE